MARPRPRRLGAAAGIAVVLLGSYGALANGRGFADSRLDLAGGGAWLASAKQGIVTLIDGPAEQVVGSVAAPGAKRGDEFSVVQAGASAYIANDTQGTVSRVDGGTYQTSEPVRFGAAGGSLRLYSGGRSLYVVDGQRRTASVTDPASLRVRETLSLTAQPGPDQSAVDAAGRLWVVDRNTGGLTWFDGGKRVRPSVGDTRSRLVLVKGRPVLVDLSRSRLGALSTDGAVEAWSCLEVRAGDQVQLLGSATSPRVYAAVSGSGMLVVSTVGRDDCGISVEVGRTGDVFGPLVEASGYVLVPNRTSGHTVVVDVRSGRVAADLAVVRPGGRLELLAKDGFVFYNDIDGDQAGVIRLDAGQWKLGRGLKKYNKSDTGRGILQPGGDQAPPEVPPAEQQPDKKDPVSPAEDRPTGPSGPVPPQPGPPPPPPETGTVALTVEVSGAGVVFADSPAPIGLSVGAQCPGDTTCVWRYPAGSRVVLRAPNTVGTATLRGFDGCQAEPAGGETRCALTPASRSTVRAVYESPSPVKARLTLTPQGGGAVTATPDGGSPTRCDASCSIEVDAGTRVSMVAEPDPGNEVARWTGVSGCGTRTTCALRVTQDREVGVDFAAMAQLTILMRGTGSGTVSGQGLSCDGKGCNGRYPVGTSVTLRATARSGSAFRGWTGCSPAASRTCAVTVSGDTQVSVTFDAVPDTTPPSIRLSGRGVTVTPTSGGRTVNISGGTTTVRLTATATDDDSAVTNTSVFLDNLETTCGNLAGTDTQTFVASGSPDDPVASSPDGSASLTVDMDRCDTDFPVLLAAHGTWYAHATSAGGRSADTAFLEISYTR